MLLKYMLFSEIPIFDPLYRNSVGGLADLTHAPNLAASTTPPTYDRRPARRR